MIILQARFAAAQQAADLDDPVANAPMRLGVFALDPRFGITNIGIDTNVFNTERRQRDFTFTVVPGSQVFLRTGKGLLTLDGNVELVYFNEFATERSVNSTIAARYDLRLNRFQPYVSAMTLNTRQRPGYEIDARARHYETEFHVGSNARVASKSTVRIDWRRLQYSFASDAVFSGRPLNEELNRTLTAVEASWRQRLTVLTSWVTRLTRESERFDFGSKRNSDSFRFNTGFELGRFALIRGSAFVGYRNLIPAAGGILPKFSGLTTDVDVSFTAPTQTRLSATVERDIEYSYEDVTPYYVQTGWMASVTQRLIGRWDVQLSGGRDRLSFQSIDATVQRKDFVGYVGGGLGYMIGDQTRASFDIQSIYRRSPLPGREYGGTRVGVSLTYGY